MSTPDDTPRPRLVADTTALRELLGIPFSDEQLAAITAPMDRPQAIIAGAGSGKTAVMAARVVWLVGHLGVDPEKILGLTFTTKAAGELATRVRTSLARAGIVMDEGEPTVSTYHAFAGVLIREHGLRLGIEPDMQVLADARRFQLAARVLRAHTKPLAHVSTHLPTTITDVIALDGQLSEHLVSTDDLRATDHAFIAELGSVAKPTAFHSEATATCLKRTELSILVDEYRQAKRDAEAMDFADQMAWGAQLAQIPEVVESLQERFDVVLLDEYQDTSIAQRNLLQSLFAGRPISAVGDPAQGIYGWRGAAAGNLTGFLADFPGPHGEAGDHYSLSVTRRCAPEIIDLAGHLAAPYYSLDDVRGVVTPLMAAEENPSGQVTVALHGTVAEEVEALADHVIAEHARGVPLSQIAVLVRNGAENGEIVRVLRQREIPVELVGLTGLLSQPEVLDVLSVLRVLDDVTQNPALLRLLTGPRWRIGDRDLALLGRRAQDLSRVGGAENATTEDAGHDEVLAQLLDEATAGIDPTEVVSLLEAVEDPGGAAYSAEARERLADISAMFDRLRRHATEPMADLTRLIIRELDLDVELSVAGLPSDNLSLLISAIADHASSEPHASLTGLLAYFQAEEEHAGGMDVSTPSEAESVKVLTMHKAKGLEFASVILPFMSKGVFPSGMGRDNWVTRGKALPTELRGDAEKLPVLGDLTKKGGDEHKAEIKAEALMEELRLAYVAITRAESRLHLSGHHWGRTQVKPRGPSEYLLTARDWLVGQGQEPEVWASGPDDGAENPHGLNAAKSWPVELDPMLARREFAAQVQAALRDPQALEPAPVAENAEDLSTVAQIRADIEILVTEAAEADNDTIIVERPTVMSATAMMAMADDESAFAAQLARPMPRRPAASARFGTQFHAWVESRFGQQSLFDPAELPGRGDEDIEDEGDFAVLKSKFEQGPYAHREPVAVETSFTLQIGGQNVIGQIDAVFADGEGYEVVDWKTNRRMNADPLQLAIYRLAWAEQQGIDPANVSAAFYYVRLDTVVLLEDAPNREELESRLGLT